jgi:hypothetical protein
MELFSRESQYVLIHVMHMYISVYLVQTCYCAASSREFQYVCKYACVYVPECTCLCTHLCMTHSQTSMFAYLC